LVKMNMLTIMDITMITITSTIIIRKKSISMTTKGTAIVKRDIAIVKRNTVMIIIMIISMTINTNISMIMTMKKSMKNIKLKGTVMTISMTIATRKGIATAKRYISTSTKMITVTTMGTIMDTITGMTTRMKRKLKVRLLRSKITVIATD